MASYLRPRRGSFANAKAQLTASNPLKSGEVFFECENIGKSQGKIKLGDATTTYSSLPYFLSMQDSSIGFTDSSNSVSTADSSFLDNSILSTSAHSTVMYAVKQLLWNHTRKIAALDSNKVPTSRTINSKALNANITLSASDVGAVPTTRTVNSKALSSDISLTASDVGASGIWKNLTHSAASCTEIGDTSAGVNVVINNANIKSAYVVMVPIGGPGQSRAGCIFVFRYKSGGNFGTLSYHGGSGYTFCAQAIVDFSGGNIAIKCAENSWGLSSVPCNVIANGIWYKTL